MSKNQKITADVKKLLGSRSAGKSFVGAGSPWKIISPTD